MQQVHYMIDITILGLVLVRLVVVVAQNACVYFLVGFSQ